MFKGTNKNTRTKSLTSFCLINFQYISSHIVDFEQKNVSWVGVYIYIQHNKCILKDPSKLRCTIKIFENNQEKASKCIEHFAKSDENKQLTDEKLPFSTRGTSVRKFPESSLKLKNAAIIYFQIRL